MGIVLLSILAFAVLMAMMSVGVLLGNRCLRGSCGGPEVMGPDGQTLTCDNCPNRSTE